MQNLLIYLLKVNIAIALFYLIYQILLSNKASFIVKRFYLLVSLIFAFALPIIELDASMLQKNEELENFVAFDAFEQLHRIQFLPETESVRSAFNFDSYSIALVIYLSVGLFILAFAFSNLYKILRNIKHNKKVRFGEIKFIINEKYTSPFSFFRFIFTKSVKGIKNTPEYIHELAHVKQLHSIDRLLVEFLLPLLWINPFIYLFKKSMIEVHEHLADSAVIKTGVATTDYQKYLYSQLKSGQFLKMASNFNYSLTKKRITMISKNISKKKTVIRTIISTVFVAGIFMFYGFNNQKLIEPIIEKQTMTFSIDSSNKVPSILPLKEGGEYWIGSHYGFRMHPFLSGKRKKHIGIDIVALRGTDVIVSADGEVIESKYLKTYGNFIKVKHNDDFITLYAHLSERKVKIGDKVKVKDVIGKVGSTGLSTRPHLHYEVRKLSIENIYECVDPVGYIQNIEEIPSKE